MGDLADIELNLFVEDSLGHLGGDMSNLRDFTDTNLELNLGQEIALPPSNVRLATDEELAAWAAAEPKVPPKTPSRLGRLGSRLLAPFRAVAQLLVRGWRQFAKLFAQRKRVEPEVELTELDAPTTVRTTDSEVESHDEKVARQAIELVLRAHRRAPLEEPGAFFYPQRLWSEPSGIRT